jgi:ribosomal protein S18 acetylase RimI-like enzyme
VVDIFYLVQMSRRKDFFTLAEVPKGSYMFLNKFLEFYREDIQQFFPGFEWPKLRNQRCIFILRNLVPVGLFIYKPHPDGVAEIYLDYVRPDYRDLKNARFLYSAQQEYLKAKRLHTFITISNIKAHQKYLLKLGFEPDPVDKNFFRKSI